MNRILFALSAIGLFFLSTTTLVAQENQTETNTAFAKGLGLYVFPNAGQDQKTQDADEMECYKWAVEQTGFDPLNPTKVEAKQVDTSHDGSAVRGAARGAAAGAAIGAIAGDAGKGAAIGAATGGMAGRRGKKVSDHQKQQANNKAAADAEAKMLEDFKKAFSACLEGKGYTVK